MRAKAIPQERVFERRGGLARHLRPVAEARKRVLNGAGWDGVNGDLITVKKFWYPTRSGR